ncbi:tumor necrosis factor receptor superfamily member 4-like [Pituophis catenifer annectens]|uniref:tumor necrosis factor receptor superfamily member 4-like n=1 Tax=Pituophis catenifer annectens TaxID=94852 RepID=UPI0039969462
MKWSLGLISLAVSLWSSPGWGLRCKDNEYPLSETKCCKLCPPGKELAKRCTGSSPTVCEPCDENYYNDKHTHSTCNRCTDCNAERGLQEKTPCRATSNTVCACLPGHAPEESQEEKRCKPCPSGYFSLGGNEKCRPWTNCTASGRKIQHPGKQDMDAICEKPSSTIPTQRTIMHPTPFPKETGVFTMNLDLSPSVVPTNPGFVWILITIVLLMTVAGILVFLFFYRRTKKKKFDILCTEIYALPCKCKENDYRLPIQEQEVGVKSDFVQG